MSKLGPEGHYPLGAPLDRSDVGAMKSAFHVIKEERFAVLQFGTRLDWFFLTRDNALAMSAIFREAMTDAFGIIPYVDVSTLPMTVEANVQKGIVEIILPTVCSSMGGNPELWMALASRLDEECRKLLM